MPLEKRTLFLSLYAEERYIQLSASCFLYKINHHWQGSIIQQSYLLFLSNIWGSYRLPTRFLSMVLRNRIRKKLINQGKNLKSSITLVLLGFTLERDNAINYKLKQKQNRPISIYFLSDLAVTQMTGLISKHFLISGFKNWLHYTLFVKNQEEFALYCAFVSKLYHNTLKLSPLKWLQKCSKVVGTSSDIFATFESLRKILGSVRKWNF